MLMNDEGERDRQIARNTSFSDLRSYPTAHQQDPLRHSSARPSRTFPIAALEQKKDA